MTDASRVTSASTTTHFPNGENVKVEQNSEVKLDNSQEGMMLTEPDEDEGGPTHSQEDPKFKGAKKPPVTAAVHEPEPIVPGPTHTDNEGDPSAGYLDKEAGMPVINNVEASETDDEFGAEEDEFAEPEMHAEEDSGDEFEDLEDLPVDEPSADEPVLEDGDTGPNMQAADFETAPAEDTVPLVDADGVGEEDEGELHFATVANAVHVIRSNRIVASMGPKAALKAGVSDVYTTDTFQDVVAHAVETKGLRKGLVQSGFVLATVKVSASKATTKLVQAKVEAGTKDKLAQIARRDDAFEQSLAIAAVGINRRFFKDVTNELKAGLEEELQRAGVRGGSRLVREMFAAHGVSYAKAILTLAKKVSALPAETRNGMAASLDLTADADFEEGDEVESPEEDCDEEMEPLGTMATVTAALSTPIRRDQAALLRAGVKSSAAMAILAGNQSLV